LPRDGRRELAELDAIFAALGHAQRRHILLVLHARGDSMTAGEIADRFDCTWPTTSRHLRQLEEAGLVTVEKSGRERVYKLEAARIDKILGGWTARFRS